MKSLSSFLLTWGPTPTLQTLRGSLTLFLQIAWGLASAKASAKLAEAPSARRRPTPTLRTLRGSLTLAPSRSRLLVGFLAIVFADISPAFAQTPDTRFELAGQLSALRLSDFNDTNVGFGGRLTYDLTRFVAIEGEFNFFPQDDVTVTGSAPGFSVEYQRRRSEALFGTKIGLRGERMGVFGRVRTGFAHLSNQGVGCGGDLCALVLLVAPVYQTEFALDLGGTVEFYPSRRLVARFDLGSLRSWHRSAAPPCWTGDCTSKNLSSRFSVGVRF
jgi:hypothetical protein